MKPLTLQLMKQWFDMIKSGVKKEEYREINAYYIARLCRMYYNPHAVRFYDFDRLVLRSAAGLTSFISFFPVALRFFYLTGRG